MSPFMSLLIIVVVAAVCLVFATLIALNWEKIIDRLFRKQGGFARQLKFMWLVIFLLAMMFNSTLEGWRGDTISLDRQSENHEMRISDLRDDHATLYKQVNPEIIECKKWCGRRGKWKVKTQ